MENYLYFRKNRPIKASHTQQATQQAMTAGFLVADIGARAGNDNINEIAAISITSVDGGGTGHASVLFEPTTVVPLVYSSTALAIATGTTHWIEPSTQAYANGVLTIDAHGTAGGYTLDDDDVITAYWRTGLETAFMYPVSALKGIDATSDTVTTLTFASILGDSTDDIVTFTHASLGFEHICKMVNDACNAHPRDGRMISVYDGHDGVVTGINNNPAAITLMEYAPEGGAAGMAT